MTKTDILVQKDQEIKILNDEIRNLTERIANLQISIGSKDEVLKSKVAELQKELELAKDQQKVLITSEDTITKYECPRCRTISIKLNNDSCMNCGWFGLKTITGKGGNTYKNLDDVTTKIQTDLEKKFKKSISELEDKQLDLEIEIETLHNESKRNGKRHNNEIEDLQNKNLDRINKYKEEIVELKDQLEKIKKNKSEEYLEVKRKDEITKLKDANEKLLKALAEAEKVGFFHRLWNKFINKSVKVQAAKEVIEAQRLIDNLQENRFWSTQYERPINSAILYDGTNHYWD